MSHHNDAPGMRGDRSRNADGQLRDKRDDTKIGTIENSTGLNFKQEATCTWELISSCITIKSLNDLITRRKS